MSADRAGWACAAATDAVTANAPLEIEANIPGSEDGYVHVGDSVAIKFDTFPYFTYGTASGTVVSSGGNFYNYGAAFSGTVKLPVPTVE